ncbi:MAG: hypothetical protein P1U34_05900 [Coxiellaceae bacterium]|nr:hypothetical protein [Coxiellaceae bacterium]
MTSKTNGIKKTELLIDGMGAASFLGGLIRADLVRLEHNKDNPKEPLTEIVQEMIITPQGFLQMYGVMTDLANKLQESGVYQQRKEKKGKQQEKR